MTELSAKIQAALSQGWTLAWSPTSGWCQDKAAEASGYGLDRHTAYRWALHTSQVQGHTSTNIQATDPDTYMAWCQILGFHPSFQSLSKLPDHITPSVAEPWVPAMVLAFVHASPGMHAWVPDYKRNWASWLTKTAAVTSPAAVLGWGRTVSPQLVAHIEGEEGTPRIRAPRLPDEALWQYTELTMRWPDMPEPVAAVTATHLTTCRQTAAGDSVREKAVQRLLHFVNATGQFDTWRDAVRAAFGFSVVICPQRGVLRDYTGRHTNH